MAWGLDAPDLEGYTNSTTHALTTKPHPNAIREQSQEKELCEDVAPWVGC